MLKPEIVATQRAVQDNPLCLGDQVRDLSDEIRILAHAVVGLHDNDDNDAGKITNMLLAVAGKLNSISVKIQSTAEIGP
jgi:hypothetical protein